MGILLDYISIHEVWTTITIIMALASLFMLSLTRKDEKEENRGTLLKDKICLSNIA